jgi:hypothetical protein
MKAPRPLSRRTVENPPSSSRSAGDQPAATPATFPAGDESTDRFFWLTAGITAVLKLVFAAIIPLTGDEAYFVVWGRFPDYGYYDHGAMTGWWVSLTLLAGESVILLRLPAVIVPLAGALLLRALLRPVDGAKANLAAVLYLFSPVSLYNVILTADTPLLLFALLAGAFAIRAVQRDRLVDWFRAGVFLGLAILTKYLALLLALAFVVFFLLGGAKRRGASMITVVAGALPGVAVNLLWNFNHGWTNVLFNVYTRNLDLRLSLLSPLLLLLFTGVVVAGPVVLYFLIRPSPEGRRSWRDAWVEMRRCGTHFALFAVGVPALAFLVVSLGRRVGLHWMFSFLPFLFLVLAAKFDVSTLRRQLRPTIAYASAIGGLALILLVLPTETYQWHRSYNSLVLGKHPAEVLTMIAPFAAEFTLVSPSYAQAAQLSYHSGRHVPVVGHGSPHGRQDDFITDFREFDGRDLMVFSSRAKDGAAMRDYFESAESRVIDVRGGRISLVLGRGFKFQAYRDAVLRPIAAEYYRMPGWLAPWSRPAPFVARYGLEQVAAP